MKNILVADDDRNVLFLISEILSREEYEVYQAVNGEQALNMARSLLPDLVVLDVMMPGIDGFEVCRHLKGDVVTRGIKVIMVTAKTSGKDIETGITAGADCYITKPFKIIEFLSKIKTQLAEQ
jgi:two-component system alkaline phosphatase synthesis response regulator PhoP